MTAQIDRLRWHQDRRSTMNAEESKRIEMRFERDIAVLAGPVTIGRAIDATSPAAYTSP
ncbi:MAG: hypothetical protein IPO51_07870 [Dehalococcoidia bacterium]|nr:hypothetical protein [Dehalococcoidia bacterium]